MLTPVPSDPAFASLVVAVQATPDHHAAGSPLAPVSVPMGFEGGALSLQHHPTGRMVERRPDWVVCAVPATPVDEVYVQLRSSPEVEVHRIGDCVAPHRAHAAVVEGERVGAAL